MDNPSDLIKLITEIDRQEWIAYEWINITTMSDPIPVYARGRLRPIEQAPAAEQQTAPSTAPSAPKS